MTEKQKRFCKEYLIDCNAAKAYVRAGYKDYKSARVEASRLLARPDIKAYIDEEMERMDSETIAKVKEVMQYLTRVLRGEELHDEVVIVSDSKGGTTEKIIQVTPSENMKMKAAENLGKRYGLFTDKVSIEGSVPIVFVDDVAEDS